MKNQTLVNSLRRNEICLYYQPIINLRSRQCIGFEALARCPAAGYTTSSPGGVLAKHPDSVVRGEFFKTTLLQSLNAIQSLKLVGDMFVGVNVDLTELTPSLCRWIISTAANFSTRLKHLAFEISESAACPITPDIFSAIETLKQAGATVLMDDYGVMHSNDERLSKLPFDGIKLDKKFLSDIDDRSALMHLKKMAAFWQCAGLHVTIEGVESAQHLAYAHQLNVNSFQGYLIAQAMPLADLQDWRSYWAVAKPELRIMSTY